MALGAKQTLVCFLFFTFPKQSVVHTDRKLWKEPAFSLE